jgi:hypothetical protein
MVKFASDVTALAIHDARVLGVAPEWILVIPAGQFSGRDGRGPYRLSRPDKVLDEVALLDMTAGLPVDYDHATDFNNRPSPAAGWMTRFEIRGGAIWANVEWTAKGRQAVASREYRYISPVFSYDEKTGEILALLRAGLTNSPNLYDTAICAKTDAVPKGREMLAEFEQSICRNFTNVSGEQFATAKASRTALASIPTPKVRALFVVNSAKDMDADPLDHERDLAAGRHSLAAFESAVDPTAKAEHLGEAATCFLAASRKYAARVRGNAARMVRFAK